jgi:hypothetical protein
MPFGMGIGIPAAMLSPFMPGMFIAAGFVGDFAPAFFDDGVLAESCVMPGIPAMGSGFFAGGFDCPSDTLGAAAMNAAQAAARR